MAAGVVQIPWYATLFRGDKFAAALAEIAPLAHALRGDGLPRLPQPRRPLQVHPVVAFEDKLSFESYWYGPEFIEWRTLYSGWYQVPILYTWNDVILEGGLKHEAVGANGD